MSEKRTIQEMPPELRPYEKCERYGTESLSDPELLGVILKTGSLHRSSVNLAEEILYADGSEDGLLNLMHYSMDELMEIPGIGRVKAIQLLCVAELCKRMSRRNAFRRLDLHSPASVADYYMEHLRHRNEEEVHIMLLDTQNSFLRSVLISRGTINSSAVSPREIFYAALRYRAAAFILVHNHPSGIPEPSEQDLVFSRLLAELGKMMNLPLRDSLVIGDNTYCSLFEKGLL